MKNDKVATKTPCEHPSGCDNVRARLTLYLLKDLDGKTMAAIAAHLQECTGCRTFAQELEPTLDLLREALAAGQSEDEPRLSPERQQKVAEAWRTAAARRKKRKPLLLRFHVMEAAAALLVGLFLWGLLLPAHHPVRRSSKLLRETDYIAMDIAEPEAVQRKSFRGRKIAELPPNGVSDMLDADDNGLPALRPDTFARDIRESEVILETAQASERRREAAPLRDQALVESKELPADRLLFMRDSVMTETASGVKDWQRAAAGVDPQSAPSAFDSSGLIRSPGPVVMRGEYEYSARSSRSRVTGSEEVRTGRIVLDAEADGRELAEKDKEKPIEPSEQLEGMLGKDIADDPADPLAPRFEPAGFNSFVKSAENAFSTFSIDVDTASYTLARNYMLRGFLPPPAAVRTEEFVNFFDYAYDAPLTETFRIYAEAAPSRFGHGLHILKIGIKGRRLGREEQRRSALTLLVDSSGSMNQPDRIGLVRRSLEMLLEALDENDHVAVIQFDSRARLLLSHTPVAQRDKILHAIESIQCGGGTNLEAGLRLAFEQAARNFISGGENRILLMSDGVVNLGETVADSIFKQLEGFRRQGLYLSVFGFGMGTYDDTMLKTLAGKGKGAYAFIDSEHEARRVFVEDLGATLNTIAEDVKIQVEFNPHQVERYRQLGYELRQLKKAQFRDDTVDAGEVGSGQSVTALYELDLSQAVEAVQAATRRRALGAVDENWLAVVRIRYRRVNNHQIEEIERRVYASDIATAFNDAGVRFRLAACVAAFAEILRGSPHVQGTGFAEVAKGLRPVALELSLNERIREFARLVETAGGMSRE